MALVCDLLGAREVLCVVEEKGSGRIAPVPPRIGNPVNENLFPSTQILVLGLYTVTERLDPMLPGYTKTFCVKKHV